MEVEESQPAPGKESLRSKVIKEYKAYGKVTQIPPKSDPLKWWKANGANFQQGPIVMHTTV